MTSPGSNSAGDLRKRAEKKAREKAAQMPENMEELSPGEIKRLLHELRVHQIELEMQNEELRRAQAELESSQARYFDLYDLAPVGYITINDKGLILQANLTAANLLGVARSDLVRKPFSGFIVKEDQDIYYLRRKQFLNDREPQSYELRMLRKDGSQLWTQIEAMSADDEDADNAPLCRVILSDIADRKRTQANLEEKELRYLSRKMIIAHEERRKRLSRELHDSLGQKIISIQLEIEWLKNRQKDNAAKSVYENIYAMTVGASEELHQICLGLRPLIMDKMGFAAAVKSLLEEFEANSNIVIEARISPVDETRLSPDTTINLYRILQEALTNVVRHSSSKTAFVYLREEGDEITLEVKDEGCGFVEDGSSMKYNFGILGIRERANMSGGRLEVNSKPGGGTRIRVSVPAGRAVKEAEQ